MALRQATDWIGYLAVRLVICVVQAVRLETCDRLAWQLAWVFGRLLRVRHRVTDENLRHAYPQLDDAERCQIEMAMWHHLFLLAAEVAHIRRKIHVTNWRKYIRLNDGPEIVRFLCEARPKVIVSGHFGNFELGGYLLGLLGYPTYSVARPLENPRVNHFLNQFRSSTGQFILPKQGSGKQIESLLESGATLALLGDQAAGDKGCWVEFFGRPASAHKAIAVFSLSFDGPLLVSYARRTGGPLQYDIGLEGVADPVRSRYKLGTVRQLTQWYSDRLEEMVKRAPEQYWWLHRRWKGKPPKRFRRSQAA